MKKIIALAFFSLLTALTFAQKTASISVDELTTGKTTGKYVFHLDKQITSADIDAVKNYYTSYFTVAFDESKHEMVVTLTKNEITNVNVLKRMMIGIDVKNITVGSESLTYDQVVDKYIK
ncbi:MAG: hypothetical protein ACK476_12010 [Fluviicola sp.]|jgi:hypothetical protein